jgi:hypothetical protein
MRDAAQSGMGWKNEANNTAHGLPSSVRRSPSAHRAMAIHKALLEDLAHYEHIALTLDSIAPAKN